MGKSAELDLKAAISTLNEIQEEVEPLQRATEDSRAAWNEGIWSGLKSSAAVGSRRGAISKKLEQVVSLASSAKAADRNVRVSLDGNEYTPDSVIAGAHVSRAVLSFISGQHKDAERWCRESLAAFPTPDAQLRLGYALALQGNRTAAMAELKKVIQMDVDSAEAVQAKKSLAELEHIKPKKWSTALLLSILLGVYGVDRFYLGYIGKGILKFITFGGFFVWWAADAIQIAMNTMRDANGMRLVK